VADALDGEHLLVDAGARGPHLWEGFEGLLGLEVGRVVDGGFGPARPLLLEVLLDVGVLVRDVQAGSDPGGDDASPVAVRGRWRAAGAGVRRVIRLGNSRLIRSGRPRSRVSRITASKKCRPWTGWSNTWVRLTSSCQMLSRCW
jgi:hypothetical protein